MVGVDSGIKNGDADTGTVERTIVVSVVVASHLIGAGGTRDVSHRLHRAIQRDVRNVRSRGHRDGSVHWKRRDAHFDVFQLPNVAGARDLECRVDGKFRLTRRLNNDANEFRAFSFTDLPQYVAGNLSVVAVSVVEVDGNCLRAASIFENE